MKAVTQNIPDEQTTLELLRMQFRAVRSGDLSGQKAATAGLSALGVLAPVYLPGEPDSSGMDDENAA